MKWKVAPIGEDDCIDWANFSYSYEEDNPFYEEEEPSYEEAGEEEAENSTVAKEENGEATALEQKEDDEGSLSYIAVSDIHRFSLCDESKTIRRDDGDQASLSFVEVNNEISSFSLCEDETAFTGFSLIGDEDTVTTTATCQKLVSFEMDDERETAMAASLLTGAAAASETDSVSCVTLPATKVDQATTAAADTTTKEELARCAICLEGKPLVRVMNKCRHPLACHDCLRLQYVVYAQQSVRNYPLKCFWPECGRLLRDVQVRRFVQGNRELERHYELEEYARYFRKQEHARLLQKQAHTMLQHRRVRNLKTVFACPACGHSNAIRPFGGETSTCNECSRVLVMDTISREEIMSVLEAVGDMLVNCPACSAIIVREDGCDHMTCVCEREFSFNEEKRKLDN